MKVDIVVPSAGESVTEATIAEIMVQSGEAVADGAEILELETDKANQIIYAPSAGKVEILVKVDDVVKVGQVIATIDTEAAAAAPPPEEKAPEPPKPVEPKVEEKPPEPPPKAPAPPADGPPARVTEDEYLASIDEKPQATPAPAPTQEEQTRKRMSGVRRTIAKRLVEAKNQTAMLTTFNEVDMTKIMEMRAKEKDPFEKKHGVKLGFMSFFAKACSSALKEFPDVNAYIDGNEIVYNPKQNIGVAVSTDKGLFVPVIRDCASLAFHEIESAIGNFAVQAKEGSLPIESMEGGTFTITNGGIFGSLLSTPILNPPQSAILGMHAIVKRPVAVDGEVVIRPMMYLALSYDHRIVDGKESVRFLVHIKEHLEDPAKLLLDY